MCNARAQSTTSAPRRAKPCLSHKAKAIAFCANIEATTVPLISSALLGSARIGTRGSTKALSA